MNLTSKENIYIVLNKKSDIDTKKIYKKGEFDILISRTDKRIFLTDLSSKYKPTYEFDLDWNQRNQVPDEVMNQISYIKLQNTI